MRVSNYAIMTAGDLSQATVASTAVILDQVFMYAIQAVITGSPVGSIKLQVSNDFDPANPTTTQPTNWTDVTSSVTAISAATSVVWEDGDSTYRWVRVLYTKTSGTGACTIRINTRGV